ncbi:MAG: carbohydrate ABC transporter substrate-binding protein [Clostridiales bacterium]|jgi:raffinose/stachyose/melibiose transport system substrate-binding protein|nr:carbohydrate ABC transporter substrate-binding protein [Clostridiales bacterium]OPZ69059.1 MAG: Bacterial extracellular solute-binding protein [Firmicutes bacterium ADurb.Bin467]
MKKLFALVLTIALLGSFALAEGVTIKTVSTFAGTDAAADTYQQLLDQWAAETGNTVEDASATSDEAWKAGVINDFAAGNEPDILFYFAKTADSARILDRVVPIAEINEAYPDLNLTENAAIAESDGKIYAIPVRAFWEGLFCNVDLFEKYNLELPTDWAKFETAVKTFKENGVVPMAVSFSDVPHYIVEFAILSSGTPEEHKARPAPGETVPESWVEGMKLLHELYEMGAFAADANATTEAITSQMFRDGQAAMQLDGSWFANGIPQERWDKVVVMPFPTHAEDADPTAFIGGVSMGFYLTRSAWEDPAKRDAAVDLLRYLTTGDNAVALGGFAFGGTIITSAVDMINNANDMLSPFQDEMDQEVRADKWFSKVPSIVDGTLTDIDGMWAEVVAANPFGK